MIIMLNGAFGVGKTSTALLLKSKLPNSMIYDPEMVGYLLRHILMQENQIESLDDFQHLPLWPSLTVETARQIYTQYQLHLIVPMTLAFPEYFHYIKKGFSQFEANVHHFCLMASAATISQRLRDRGEEPDCWAEQQIPRCVDAFRNPEYEQYVDTDVLDVEGVVDAILEQIQ